MPNAFDFSSSPFDGLDADEQRVVRDAVDIAYFREGETILDPGDRAVAPVRRHQGPRLAIRRDELVATYGPHDCFDGRSLVAGRASSRFVAAEEVLAYELAEGRGQRR